MSALTDWERSNSDYLAAALEWLRLRLQRLAAGGAEASLDAQVDRAAEALAAAETVNPPPAMLWLAERFGLARFEIETLLLCASAELDPHIPGLCARAQGDPNRAYPTFALALALFDNPSWEALTPGRPLRYWQLVEINQGGAQPLIACPLRADERVAGYLKGLNYLDERLASLLSPLDPPGEESLPPSQQAGVEQALSALQQFAVQQQAPVVQLLGSDGLSKELVARQAARRLGLHLYHLSAEALPASLPEIEILIRLWGREVLLTPVALYLDAQSLDAGQSGEGQALGLHRFLERANGLTFLAIREPLPGLHLEGILLDVSRPTPVEQKSAWSTALAGQAGLNGNTPDQLAAQFDLNWPTIYSLASSAVMGSPQDEGARARLWQAALVRTRPRMEALAQRIDAKATWEDIVLPEKEAALLRQISAQVGQRSKVYDEWGFRQKMNRGLGISALFAGESGTGKTMAAEVLANDLHLDLYRIDLSSVVSKYIGETEKNLRKLFDAAEGGGAILFFDEADALFGKRSEVKDSHDRYANIEINYLLQRMEAYRGLAILATNQKSSLDPAFVRRLRFIVNFPFPSAVERKLIWQRAFPPQTPLQGLDFERLARFNLTGGNIHSIALNAAFLAAQAGTPVTPELVLEAMRTEFVKLERPVNEVDFRL